MMRYLEPMAGLGRGVRFESIARFASYGLLYRVLGSATENQPWFDLSCYKALHLPTE